MPALALVGDSSLELGEHVGGHGLEALRGLGQRRLSVVAIARRRYGLAERGQMR